MAPFDMKTYARRGAEARLSELAEEARSILAAFPDLHRGDLPFQAPARVRGRSLKSSQPAPNGIERRRRKMSTAHRKAVGERMRKYWAERKAAESK